MRTKKQKANTIQRNPHCGLLKQDFRKQGIEVQTWGLDANRELVYCGVHFIPELSPRWLWKLHNNWARWRKWYDNLPEHRAEDYPAKHTPRVAFTGAHPVDNPALSKWLAV